MNEQAFFLLFGSNCCRGGKRWEEEHAQKLLSMVRGELGRLMLSWVARVVMVMFFRQCGCLFWSGKGLNPCETPPPSNVKTLFLGS